MVLLLFTILSVVGVFTPGYVGYVWYAILLWMLFYPIALIISKHRDLAE